MQTDWQMPRRADACRGCARVFEVGDAIRAFLYAIPSGFERRDFCPACTNNDPQALASWQTRRANPATPRSFAFDCEAVFAFFVRLTPQERGSPAGPLQSQDTGFALELRSAAESADAPHAAQPAQAAQFRFVLALLLWRKRVLRLEQTRQVHGQELWEFSAPRNGQRFSVCRPDLDEDEIERLSQQLEALLGGAAELAAASLGAGTHA